MLLYTKENIREQKMKFKSEETKDLKESSAKWLIPYVIFTLYASILSLSIYFLNIT